MFDRVLFYLDNCSVICTVTSCYVLHQTHSQFWHILISVYSGKFRHIQAYSALLRHINRWGITKDYWGLFRHTQNPVQPSHVHKLTTFWALTYLKPKAYSKLCETLTWHIQNPVIEQFIQTLFSHIQNLVWRSHMLKLGIFGIMKSRILPYFPKRSILDRWEGSIYADLSIKTHWLVESLHAMYCLRHIQKPVYYRKFSHIQVYSRPI